MTGLDPDYPQRGPYEASEGIYPGRGQGKTGGGQGSEVARHQVLSSPSRGKNWGRGNDEGQHLQKARLKSTTRPNPVMTVPEILLTHCQF